MYGEKSMVNGPGNSVVGKDKQIGKGKKECWKQETVERRKVSKGRRRCL
jgi:hypothetical protein